MSVVLSPSPAWLESCLRSAGLLPYPRPLESDPRGWLLLKGPGKIRIRSCEGRQEPTCIVVKLQVQPDGLDQNYMLSCRFFTDVKDLQDI